MDGYILALPKQQYIRIAYYYFFSGGRKRHNTVKFVLDEEKWEITKKLRRIILGGGILQ